MTMGLLIYFPFLQYLTIILFALELSHFSALLLFAFFVSVVFGVLSKDEPRQCAIYGAKVFAAFVGIALLLGWVMYALAP